MDKCLDGQLLGWTNVWLDKCLVGKMSGSTIIRLDKCRLDKHRLDERQLDKRQTPTICAGLSVEIIISFFRPHLRRTLSVQMSLPPI